MEFNVHKFSVINLGRENQQNMYTLRNVPIREVYTEKDLWVVVSSDVRPRKQYAETKNRAKRVLRFIAMIVRNRNAKVILEFYLIIIRPHPGYAAQLCLE